MRRDSYIFLIVILLTMLTACQNDLKEGYNYEAVKPVLKAGLSNLDFEGEGGENSFNINSNTFWTLSCSENWIHLSATEGRGNNTVKVSADNNPSTREGRSATIIISNGYQQDIITVEQSLTPEQLSVNQESVSFDYSKGAATIIVNSNIDWTASSPVNWCTVLAINSTELEISVSQNDSYSPRSTNVSVMGLDKFLTVSVDQAAAKEPSINSVSVTDITNTTAIAGISFSSSDLSVTQCGICYSSTTSLPTIENSKYIYSVVDTYSSSKYYTIQGLTMDTEYYVRGFVKTVAGITYSDFYYFKTLAIIAPDEDDNVTPNL